MRYDIFISYKRKNIATANNLYYRLTTKGYSTFFDLDEMRKDDFDKQIFSYIESAKDIFVILDKGSLDGCKKDHWDDINHPNQDWFCIEIAHALKYNKNIIPILLDDFKMPKEYYLPKKIKGLAKKNAPEFSFAFFNEYLDNLKNKGYITSEICNDNVQASIFKFYSNENCHVFSEGKLVCVIDKNAKTPSYFPVRRHGEYMFTSSCDKLKKRKKITCKISQNEEKVIFIKWIDAKFIVTKSLLYAIFILLFLLSIAFFDSYKKGMEINTLYDAKHYSPNILKKIMFSKEYNILLENVDSINNVLFDKYDIVVNDKITLTKLKTLFSIMENMSYTSDYPSIVDKTIDSTYVNKFELSIGEWNDFMPNHYIYGDKNQPVSNVTIKEVQMFIDTLRFYTGKPFSLPTKKQWIEYAKVNESFPHAGEDNPNNIAWFNNNSNGKKHNRSDLKNSNELDLFNMSGNVAEICSSDTIINGKRNNVVKGGSYSSYPTYLNIYFDDYLEENQKSPNIGFRIIINKQ